MCTLCIFYIIVGIIQSCRLSSSVCRVGWGTSSCIAVETNRQFAQSIPALAHEVMCTLWFCRSNFIVLVTSFPPGPPGIMHGRLSSAYTAWALLFSQSSVTYLHDYFSSITENVLHLKILMPAPHIVSLFEYGGRISNNQCTIYKQVIPFLTFVVAYYLCNTQHIIYNIYR